MKFLSFILLCFFAPCLAACAAGVGDVQLGVKSEDGPLEPVWITKTANKVIGWNSSGVLGPITMSGGSGSSDWADITSKPTTLAGYGITDAITAILAATTYQPIINDGTLSLAKLASNPLARANHTGTQAWSTLTSTPTTLAGYGITDAITAALAASTYQPIINDGTLSLAKLASNPLARANHTGTQAWSTLTSTPTTLAGYGITDAITAALAASTYQPLNGNLSTLAAGFGGLYVAPGIIRWNGTGYQILTGGIPADAGGTGQSLYTLGDMLYSNGDLTFLSKLAGNTTTTKKFLTQTGNGTVSAAPAWGTITAADVQGVKAEIVIAVSDETTALTTGTAKVIFRMPHAMTLTSIRLQVNTAPTGSVIIVDVKESGTTVFSTKPQIAISAFTSLGGAVPGTLSDTSLADDAEITINIDQIGSTIAGKGLKVTLIGTRP